MADEEFITVHHPAAFPGHTIKTRSGIHYVADDKGNFNIHPRHVKELTHKNRGHRIGDHPSYRQVDPEAGDTPAEETTPTVSSSFPASVPDPSQENILTEDMSTEPTESVEVPASVNA